MKHYNAAVGCKLDRQLLEELVRTHHPREGYVRATDERVAAMTLSTRQRATAGKARHIGQKHTLLANRTH